MGFITAIKDILQRLLRADSSPFSKTPDSTTIAAMKEAEHLAKDPNVKRYSDVEEALKELKR